MAQQEPRYTYALCTACPTQMCAEPQLRNEMGGGGRENGCCSVTHPRSPPPTVNRRCPFEGAVHATRGVGQQQKLAGAIAATVHAETEESLFAHSPGLYGSSKPHHRVHREKAGRGGWGGREGNGRA